VRFYDIGGRLGRDRRSVSRTASVSPEDVKDVTKLAEIIRQMSVRIQELEARLPPEAVEFEMDITGTASSPTDYSIHHNTGTPIRYYVTQWSNSSAPPSIAPAIVRQITSTLDRFDFKSHSEGRMVIRIEPSPYEVTN
jgi:hypothetical protein